MTTCLDETKIAITCPFEHNLLSERSVTARIKQGRIGREVVRRPFPNYRGEAVLWQAKALAD